MKASKQPKLVGGKGDIKISLTTTQPVTYSWENIEIYLETNQGNCFKRQPPVQKRILDNGKVLTLTDLFKSLLMTLIYYFQLPDVSAQANSWLLWEPLELERRLF